MRIDVGEAANIDASNAAEFYEGRQRGLGIAFLAALDSLLEVIGEHPMRFRVIRGSWRRALMPRFPYCVIYRLEPDRIFVLAILHGRRNPSIWQHRPT